MSIPKEFTRETASIKICRDSDMRTDDKHDIYSYL